jgi:hypothetical protein
VTRKIALPAYLMIAACVVSAASGRGQDAQTRAKSFQLMETSIDAIHRAYRAGVPTSHQLTQAYLDRINAYDQRGRAINSIITISLGHWRKR